MQKGLNDDSFDILCRYCENASTLEEYNLPEGKNLVRRVKDFASRLKPCNFLQI
jgi:hypothetical protein